MCTIFFFLELCINIFEDDLHYYYSGLRGTIRINKKYTIIENPRFYVETLTSLPDKDSLKKISTEGISVYWIYDYFFNIEFTEDFAVNVEDFGIILPKIPDEYMKYETQGIEIDKNLNNSLIISYPKGMEYHAFRIAVEYLQFTNSSLNFDFQKNLNDLVDFFGIFFCSNEIKLNLSKKNYESMLFIKITLKKLDEIFL